MAVTSLPFVFPGVPQVRCAFQTRPGGVSEGPWAGGNIGFGVGDNPDHVNANREDLRQTLGLDALVEVHQVHGVVTVMEAYPPIRKENAPAASGMAAGTTAGTTAFCVDADGMSTSRPGVGLMVKSADCQPILFTHESGRFVAGIHAGWQGNRQSYPQVAVRDLCAQYTVAPQSLLAVRGPSLGPSRSQFVNFDSEWGPDFAHWYAERERTVNLWQLARDQLLEAGLRPERIFSLDLCTASLDLFFSFRRDKVTGRQGSVVWIEK